MKVAGFEPWQQCFFGLENIFVNHQPLTEGPA